MKKLTLSILSLIACLNSKLYSTDSNIDEDNYSEFHLMPETVSFALDAFTSFDHQTLKSGILQRGDFKFECLNPDVLSQIEPSMFRIISGRNFLLNIKKVSEININDIFSKDVQVQGIYNFAEYTYQNTYGMNHQKIFLLCAQDCSLNDFKRVKNFLTDRYQVDTAKGGYYISRDISNFLQIGTNARLYPMQFGEKLKNALINDYGSNYWTPSISQYFAGHKDLPIFQYAIENLKLNIVTNPVHDLSDQSSPMDMVKSGNLSFQDAWQAIKDYKFDSNFSTMRVLMPIAESNTIAGLKRGHWTTLMLTKSDNQWQAQLIDSKGFLSDLYNRQVISDTLSKEGIELNRLFLGHQGVLNNSDCGYFTIAYILELLKGSNIKELTNEYLINRFSQIQ